MLFFQGNWKTPFNKDSTETRDFHKSNGETVPLQFMQQSSVFNYAETDQFQVCNFKD